MNQITDKQRDNLEMALVMWTAVDPETVWPGLGGFACGTYACFGGHVATWQYFIDQGVITIEDEDTRLDHDFLEGEPVMRTPEGLINGPSVSGELFGVDLFGWRNCRFDREVNGGDYVPDNVTDHELVLRRLEYVLFGAKES